MQASKVEHERSKSRNRRDALDSLHGAPPAGGREQRVYTPQSIVDALLRLWPDGIRLDPCSGPDSIVPAAVHVVPDQDSLPRQCAQRGTWIVGDGLAVPWVARTYANPPFGTLRVWLERGAASSEVAMLVPVRTRRPWWRAVVFGEFGPERCWLDSTRFAGHRNSYPADLVMLYWGSRTDEFRKAFECLGTVH